MLTPRGVAIDVRPATVYRPLLAIRRGSRRIDLGVMRRDADEGLVAAQDATRRAIREGWFELVHRTRRQWRSRYANLADLERMVAANENWRLPAALRRRLTSAWVGGDTIELTRVFSLTILRRRSVQPPGRETAIR